MSTTTNSTTIHEAEDQVFDLKVALQLLVRVEQAVESVDTDAGIDAICSLSATRKAIEKVLREAEEAAAQPRDLLAYEPRSIGRVFSYA
jgi:hypothetical protein